jgi:hypothetical protein
MYTNQLTLHLPASLQPSPEHQYPDSKFRIHRPSGSYRDWAPSHQHDQGRWFSQSKVIQASHLTPLEKRCSLEEQQTFTYQALSPRECFLSSLTPWDLIRLLVFFSPIPAPLTSPWRCTQQLPVKPTTLMIHRIVEMTYYSSSLAHNIQVALYLELKSYLY